MVFSFLQNPTRNLPQLLKVYAGQKDLSSKQLFLCCLWHYPNNIEDPKIIRGVLQAFTPAEYNICIYKFINYILDTSANVVIDVKQVCVIVVKDLFCRLERD